MQPKPLLGKLPLWTPNPAGIPAPKVAWVLNEKGGNTIFDQIGKNRGTINGATWIGESLTFVTDDFVTTDYPISAVAHTIAARFKVNSMAADSFMVDQWDTSDPRTARLLINAAANSVIYRLRPAGNSDTSLPISINQWYTGIGTFDGTNQRLYVDGILADSAAPGATGALAQGVEFGRNSAVAGNFFNGWLDWVMMWDIALTASQALYMQSYPFYAWEYPEPWQYYVQAAPGGLSIPVAMHHYKQMQGS